MRTGNEIDAVCLVSPHDGPYLFYKCHAFRNPDDGVHAVIECAYGLFFFVCQTVNLPWSAATHLETVPSFGTHRQGGREARSRWLQVVSYARVPQTLEGAQAHP